MYDYPLDMVLPGLLQIWFLKLHTMLLHECLTSVTLLDALGNGQTNMAWNRFVLTYSGLLKHWALRWGASHEDVDDMVQETMLNVFRSIREFDYDPNGSFRSWLKVVAWRSLKYIYSKNRKSFRDAGQIPVVRMTSLQNLLNVAARDDLLQAFESMAEAEILELACTQVRPMFRESTWQAFRLMEFEQKPGEVIASELGLSIAAVHSAVYRVRKKVIQAARLLNQNF